MRPTEDIHDIPTNPTRPPSTGAVPPKSNSSRTAIIIAAIAVAVVVLCVIAAKN